MKSEKQVCKAVEKCIDSSVNYYGMSYQDGVRDALEWVLEQLDDDDFEFTP